MQSNPANLQKRVAELKAKREELFNKFVRHPDETRLALEIKVIDDHVAEFVQQLSRETGKRRSDSFKFGNPPKNC